MKSLKPIKSNFLKALEQYFIEKIFSLSAAITSYIIVSSTVTIISQKLLPYRWRKYLYMRYVRSLSSVFCPVTIPVWLTDIVRTLHFMYDIFHYHLSFSVLGGLVSHDKLFNLSSAALSAVLTPIAAAMLWILLLSLEA